MTSTPSLIWVLTIVSGIALSIFAFKKWNDSFVIHSVKAFQDPAASFQTCVKVIRKLKGKTVDKDVQNHVLQAWIKTDMFEKALVTFNCEGDEILYNVIPSFNIWPLTLITSIDSNQIKQTLLEAVGNETA